VNLAGGKGSHIKIIWPATQKMIVIPAGLEKHVLYYVLKEIETCSGVTWEKIREAL
jgi:hypothetical protein